MKYILRSDCGTKVVDYSENIVLKGIKQYINTLCLRELSTFDGRENAAKIVLDRKSIVPIYVNHEVLLFPTESIRNQECIYINYFEVLSAKENSNGTCSIIFSDLSELEINITKRKIDRQLKLCNEIVILQGL